MSGLDVYSKWNPYPKVMPKEEKEYLVVTELGGPGYEKNRVVLAANFTYDLSDYGLSDTPKPGWYTEAPDFWQETYDYRDEDVIYWMPYPEAPADDYKTDGELYDDCLTASSQEEAADIFKTILRIVDENGYIAVLDIVHMRRKGHCLKNYGYASTHGWTRFETGKFTVKQSEDKSWKIYLGNPRPLDEPWKRKKEQHE